MTTDDELRERVAQIIAHRICTNEEHSSAQGKLAGFCVVCGVPWPCGYAGPRPIASDLERRTVELLGELASLHRRGILPDCAGVFAQGATLLREWRELRGE